MSDTDVLLLNLEVEAAAARNADLSRQLERLTDELACSTVHRVERADDVSRGTQTEFDISRDVALDLDDLLFEMAEVMFRLYPTTPLDLSNRRDDSSRRVEELSQRCLREMRSLKIAWETKLEGYNKFIEDLQKGLGEYYRSLEEVQCQLRNKEAQCNTLTRDNAELSEHCAELEERLRLVQEAAGNAGEDVTQLMRQVTDLETERQRLLDRETVLLNTVASLRAECALGPWKNTGFVKERTSFVQPSSHSQVPVRHGASQENDTRGRTGRDASVGDVMFACQGSAVNRAFPEWCVSPEKVIDYCCRMNNST
ncbi:hypothetical protein DQ04_01021070 [Trypanosoma grayi]|uniref:hypothetical protein n=1 Tax=Trypanosoma grayi TaxID=71804 RepID=UPI0004F4375E|nr:hypothetical protein DQ04_01021070 [Trypanosoma grayi]KEG13406.1 hypothetical protein DQ04_01021070 [Trypanosoma grayi]